jgi:hypothetical protein
MASQLVSAVQQPVFFHSPLLPLGQVYVPSFSEPLHFFYLCEAQLERLIEGIKLERKSVDLPEDIQKALVDRKNTFGQLLRMPLAVSVSSFVIQG